jgi:hypothetical protein
MLAVGGRPVKAGAQVVLDITTAGVLVAIAGQLQEEAKTDISSRGSKGSLTQTMLGVVNGTFKSILGRKSLPSRSEIRALQSYE